MTASFAQTPVFVPQSAIATSISATLAAPVTPGNLLIAVLTVGGSVTSPVFPWSGVPDVSQAGAGNPMTYILSKIAGASESPTISFSSATSRQLTLALSESAPSLGNTWLGLDQPSTGTPGTVSSLTAGPTTAQAAADNIAVVGVSLNGALGGTPTLSDGYTIIPTVDTAARGFVGYKFLTSAAATQTTAAWTTARNAGCAIATYKQQPAASANQGAGFLALL